MRMPVNAAAPTVAGTLLVAWAATCAAGSPQIAFIQTHTPQDVLAPTAKSINTYQGMA